MTEATTPGHRLNTDDAPPEVREWLAKIRERANATRHLDQPPPWVPGDGIVCYAELRQAVAALVAAREAAGLSVPQVAERAGMPAELLHRIESESVFINPPWNVFAKYARALGLRPSLTFLPDAS